MHLRVHASNCVNTIDSLIRHLFLGDYFRFLVHPVTFVQNLDQLRSDVVNHFHRLNVNASRRHGLHIDSVSWTSSFAR